MPKKQSAYYEIDGVKLIRMTSMLGATLAKPALVPWAIKQTAEGAAEYVRAHEGSLIDTDAMTKEIKAYANRNRDEAGKRGTEFHEAAMLVFEEEPPVAPGMNALAQWVNTCGVKPIALENVVYSRELGCAGTFDALVEIQGKKVLVDYKTGGVYQDHAIQLAGYAGMWQRMNPGKEIDLCQVIQIDCEAETYTVHTVNDWLGWYDRGFLPLLQVWTTTREKPFTTG